MVVLETSRLVLRRFDLSDASFILRLVNEPAWLQFIGDKGVRNVDDARRYLREGPLDMYERHGFGLYCVQAKDSGAPIGMCGLIKRDSLPDVDIGFAFLPAYWGAGYAHEAADAVLAYGARDLGLRRVIAITTPTNDSSIRLLGKLGMKFERILEFAPNDPVKVFAKALGDRPA